MKIPFRKIGKTPQEFEYSEDNAVIKGTLTQRQRDLVMLSGHISGTLQLTCDICAENFDTILDEELTVLISDGVFHGNDDQYDVVEFFDGSIDIEAFLTSELESIKSDYHSCPKCLKQ